MLTTLLALCAAALAGEVRLNSATVDEFAAIDGIDEATATRIVGLRETRGQLYLSLIHI